MTTTAVKAEAMLLLRVRARSVALPVRCVLEVMRPLPIEPLAGVPAFVLGVSMIRGVAVPVLDTATLLSGGHPTGPPERLVTLRVDGRPLALVVDAWLGIVKATPDSFPALASLLDPDTAGVVDRIGALDGRLCTLLATGRLVPDDVWAALERSAPGPAKPG